MVYKNIPRGRFYMKYDENKKMETAQRLKECRKEKGLSHERLANELKEKYDIDISSGVLKNYEISEKYHAKFTAGFGMNIKYLYTLADFYNVSTDYLLGRTDKKSVDPNIRAIGEFTGLSDEAVGILEFLNKSVEHKKCDLISLLIKDSKPFDLFYKEHYGDKCFTMKEHKNIRKEYSKAYADVLQSLWILIYNPYSAIKLFFEEEDLPIDLMPKLSGRSERLCMVELQERVFQFRKLIMEKEERESNGE